MNGSRLAAAVALVAAAAACDRPAERASERSPADSAALAALTEDDVHAVIDAVNGADVRFSGVGANRATTADVRAFASRLGSAHPQKVTDRPPPVGGAGGTAVVAPLRAFLDESASRLDAMPAGPAFDRAWIDVQMEAHVRALAALDRLAGEGAARAGDLPDLVGRTRSEVQAHLDEARALRQRLP